MKIDFKNLQGIFSPWKSNSLLRKISKKILKFITFLSENFPCWKYFTVKIYHNEIFYRMIRFFQMEFKIKV